jgi:glycosyltransferase involved in cell wall biosynthesis
MKITFVIPRTPNLSGGIRVIAIYAQKLQERGHQVAIVATPTSRPSRLKRLSYWLPWQKKPSHLDDLDVPLIRLPPGKIINDKNLPDGDVVIATLWRTAKPVMDLSPSKGAKVYFIQHYETFNTRTKKNQVRDTWRLPMHKITVCNWLTDLARERYADSDVSTVPNAVDTNLFTATPRGKQARPTVGVMYSTAPFKGCDISLAAFSLAKKTYPELKLLAFGPQKIDTTLPLPPDTKMEVRPAQEEIVRTYASCDAWLFGSRTEGFGLPILEAMACRTPVLGTPAGAAPELISAGGGILVNHEDPENMADAIQRVVQMSEAEWKTISDAAYRAATQYTWDDAVFLFEQALMRAMERARRGEVAGGVRT